MGEDKDDPFADSLDIESEIVEYVEGEIIETEDENFHEVDYEFARNNIMKTLNKAAGLLDDMISVSKQAQTPRSYEVVSTMVKTIIDGNKDLVELDRKKVDLDNESGEKSENKVVNNNLIVTTEQLQRMLIDQGIETGMRRVLPKPEEV